MLTFRFVPYIGMVTIWMNEVQWVKYAVIGGLGLFAILQREQ
jgi:signal peptidase I